MKENKTRGSNVQLLAPAGGAASDRTVYELKIKDCNFRLNRSLISWLLTRLLVLSEIGVAYNDDQFPATIYLLRYALNDSQ